MAARGFEHLPRVDAQPNELPPPGTRVLPLSPVVEDLGGRITAGLPYFPRVSARNANSKKGGACWRNGELLFG